MSYDGELTNLLVEVLKNKGAKLIGIGEMSGVENLGYSVGISVAVPVPKNICIQLKNKPTKEYYDMYYELNSRLNEIVKSGEDFLLNRGYKAYAQTTDKVKSNAEKKTPVPHKTVACKAGIGWIGKNCLLVTKEYGSAVRLSSLLTDAPLKWSSAVTKSLCGSCMVCVKSCPAQALKGELWQAGMDRDKLF